MLKANNKTALMRKKKEEKTGPPSQQPYKKMKDGQNGRKHAVKMSQDQESNP